MTKDLRKPDNLSLSDEIDKMHRSVNDSLYDALRSQVAVEVLAKPKSYQITATAKDGSQINVLLSHNSAMSFVQKLFAAGSTQINVRELSGTDIEQMMLTDLIESI